MARRRKGASKRLARASAGTYVTVGDMRTLRRIRDHGPADPARLGLSWDQTVRWIEKRWIRWLPGDKGIAISQRGRTILRDAEGEQRVAGMKKRLTKVQREQRTLEAALREEMKRR